MKFGINIEGQPLCPDCGCALSCESAGDRDTEAMGGDAIEYFVCDNGCGGFHIIDGEMYPNGEA